MMNFPSTAKSLPWTASHTGVKLHLYVDDVDDLYERAVDAGATVLMPLQDCFWGDRYAILETRSAIVGRWRPGSKTSRPGSFRSGPANSMPSTPISEDSR